jgi:hypothetical protein
MLEVALKKELCAARSSGFARALQLLLFVGRLEGGVACGTSKMSWCAAQALLPSSPLPAAALSSREHTSTPYLSGRLQVRHASAQEQQRWPPGRRYVQHRKLGAQAAALSPCCRSF